MSYDLCQEVEWLNWPVGRDVLGYLRRVAVDFELKRLVDSKQIPFEYQVAPNAADNCRHLELRTPRCIITMSHVQRREGLPRRAVFRSNLGLSNQLFFDFSGKLCAVKEGPYYLLLTHGASGRTPDFIYLGVPEPEITGWITKMDLLSEACSFGLIRGEVETISEESLVKFKSHILRTVQRHGS